MLKWQQGQSQHFNSVTPAGRIVSCPYGARLAYSSTDIVRRPGSRAWGGHTGWDDAPHAGRQGKGRQAKRWWRRPVGYLSFPHRGQRQQNCGHTMQSQRWVTKAWDAQTTRSTFTISVTNLCLVIDCPLFAPIHKCLIIKWVNIIVFQNLNVTLQVMLLFIRAAINIMYSNELHTVQGSCFQCNKYLF